MLPDLHPPSVKPGPSIRLSGDLHSLPCRRILRLLLPDRECCWNAARADSLFLRNRSRHECGEEACGEGPAKDMPQAGVLAGRTRDGRILRGPVSLLGPGPTLRPRGPVLVEWRGVGALSADDAPESG